MPQYAVTLETACNAVKHDPNRVLNDSAAVQFEISVKESTSYRHLCLIERVLKRSVAFRCLPNCLTFMT